MAISSRFSVGIHILTLIAFNKDGVSSSDYLAASVNTNPALIRKITGMLKKAGLVEVRPGVAGTTLARKLSEITLLDVYQAVDVVQDNELFNVHPSPSPKCEVGRNIQETIVPILSSAQLALEKVLQYVTIEDIVKDIHMKEGI